MLPTDSRNAARPHAHAHVIPVGATLLAAALVTDLLYCWSLNSQWETFSIWLLTAGLVVAGLAALTLAVEALLGRVRSLSWPRFLAVGAAALISLANAFVHSRDGYTAIVPTGLTLSVLATIILLAVGVRGWDLTAPSGDR